MSDGTGLHGVLAELRSAQPRRDGPFEGCLRVEARLVFQSGRMATGIAHMLDWEGRIAMYWPEFGRYLTHPQRSSVTAQLAEQIRSQRAADAEMQTAR